MGVCKKTDTLAIGTRSRNVPKLGFKTDSCNNFDFYWKLFAASTESLHISTSMVKGEEVRVGGLWLLSDQGQLQPPSLIPGVTIPAIWLLSDGRHGHQQ